MMKQLLKHVRFSPVAALAGPERLVADILGGAADARVVLDLHHRRGAEVGVAERDTVLVEWRSPKQGR